MGKISKLLKWGHKVTLRDANSKVLMDVWIRILDDDNLEEAYLDARLASAEYRAELRDPKSKKHQDDIAKIEKASREECMSLIKAAKGGNLTAEAFSNVVRPDLPTIAEIAIDPDAPTLEEQEKLDTAISKINDEYAKAIDEYVDTKSAEIDEAMAHMTDEELREAAKSSTIDLLVLTLFIKRVLDEKVWRGTFEDQKYKIPGFESYEDFLSTDSGIKDQLREAYNDLEMSPEEIKN